jgi:hypothetical protein
MTATMAGGRARAGTGSGRTGALPEPAVRLVSALLALAVAGVHVADQGGITAFNSPDWLGWAYRLIEVGGVLTAVVMLLPWSAWLGWAAGVLLGAGPFVGYVASRSVGVPGDHADIGNWGYWLGTVSLIVEAALVIVCAAMLLSIRQRRSPVPAAGGPAGTTGTPVRAAGAQRSGRQA